MAETLQRCPICGGPATATFRPFCSRRCADVDLGRWLTGVYRIPAREDDESPPPATEPLAPENESQ